MARPKKPEQQLGRCGICGEDHPLPDLTTERPRSDPGCDRVRSQVVLCPRCRGESFRLDEYERRQFPPPPSR